MLRPITLFRLRGIVICVDATWPAVLVLLAWSLADAVFPAQAPGLDRRLYWAMGLTVALLFFATIVLRELALAWAARPFEIPVSSITLFVAGGVTELELSKNQHLFRLFGFVLAPAVTTAFLSGSLVSLTFWLHHHGAPVPLTPIVSCLAELEIGLFLFNLIPALPLDGGRVLQALLYWRWKFSYEWRAAAHVPFLIGSWGGWAVMCFAVLPGFDISVLVRAWILLLGAYLRYTAWMSYRQVAFRDACDIGTVSLLLPLDAGGRRPEVSLEAVLRRYQSERDLRSWSRHPIEYSASRIGGGMPVDDLWEVMREWDRLTLQELMSRSWEQRVDVNARVIDAIASMCRACVPLLLMFEGDRLVGLVSYFDYIRDFDLRFCNGHFLEFDEAIRHSRKKEEEFRELWKKW